MSDLNEQLSRSFIQQMDQNAGILFKVAQTYCWDKEDQKDLIQEISIQAWRSFPRFNPEFKFSTWLYRVALNVAISHIRKEVKRKSEPLDEEYNLLPEEESQGDENISELYKAIGKQSEINKAIILLHLEEKSYAEIAEILGISESNVGTKLNRIKKEIKNQLNP
ncbi:RNA polymerase sigma factor [Algoriphagus sediminis]|uniref:RNA polymerase sigma factor n=1 Tax=Algoriphagus sediminis TaxID=3057113 RepID=A0ABT7YCB1_9BACT|nr:RNA polymerase sigma factor [Algoriphagus sediminis]MDN3204170.1 RNA polymerase sigma factor [Algoriphagus sediminis]